MVKTMDECRRELGKSAIVDMRKKKDKLHRNVCEFLKRIDKLDDEIRDIVDEIIEDGGEYYR